jgi:DNA-binding YbaB/EbfC family protein
MADFLGLMKQATELKSKMEAMQAELDQVEVEGISGGGLVSVKLSGKGEMRGVKIDGSLMKPEEKEIVEASRVGTALGSPCRAVSDQEARTDHGAARRCHADGLRANPDLQ